MKKYLLPLLFLLPVFCFGQDKHVFSLSKNEFLLDGKPFQIISGEMHPARIPREYWRDRIRMTKAMGCNTIAAYIFWNYHEATPGVFDFKTGNHDIAEFIRICKEEGMWVLLRPGPYVCAEWDFGGLPSWLLKIPDIKVRCMDPRYMSAVSRYVTHLAAEVKSLQCTNGGPIIMSQIENEYGSYANDKTYLETLRKLWVQNGINVPFYTADGATPYMLEAGNIDGAAIGLDSGSSDEDFAQATKRNPNVPSFSSETYPGWLTHWKEKFAKPDTNSLKKEITYLLENHKSFNLYVIHGGTNFGFTAGANAFSTTQYQPDLTSYDYDAPISEQGQATPKYYMLRNLISKYVKYKIPAVPQAPKAISIPAITLAPFTSIWQQLPKPFLSPQPQPMEYYDQNQGLMLYRTKLIGHKKGTLTITEPHDYAMVFVDDKLIDTVYRDGGKWNIKIPESSSKDPVLDILVEGMGHINFAQYIIDRKGITDRVTLNGMTLMDWQIYPLPMTEAFIKTLKPAKAEADAKGMFFKGTFDLQETGDTYFDLSNYAKGIIYVNGHNLGRYWNTGPQQRLYCPASWLKKGNNEIIVFDFHLNEAKTISGKTTLE
ncbi:beta-galactosidase [Mucilaginibacter lappiensis]|uniref:Beta-galactosidase n=1 Tax=Mucilaginibacter lappiensis TaxID=354630 RepID=A0ABR6PJA2_9SPHI|nr:beta-galactosidase family protein [Mucilaginibacter lappiensis]MBB6109842.1 beta-galactosidase [Mucilaginibacter lappiensis]SIR17496.1 beta-galactosidase [Mucilaginibacter lappiensis]